MIAFRTDDENRQEDDQSTQAPASAGHMDDSYEVPRSAPRHGDSFVGGLDILTVHQMIEEQNRLKSDASEQNPI